jgi:hypothetical protein
MGIFDGAIFDDIIFDVGAAIVTVSGGDKWGTAKYRFPKRKLRLIKQFLDEEINE